MKLPKLEMPCFHLTVSIPFSYIQNVLNHVCYCMIVLLFAVFVPLAFVFPVIYSVLAWHIFYWSMTFTTLHHLVRVWWIRTVSFICFFWIFDAVSRYLLFHFDMMAEILLYPPRQGSYFLYIYIFGCIVPLKAMLLSVSRAALCLLH